MEDFQPFFCIEDSCKTPFDRMSSFDDLLWHLRSHLGERYCVYKPCQEIELLDEQDFESVFDREDEITLLKEVSLYTGPFLFRECPFCRSGEDSNSPGHQIGLREHIENHMRELAFMFSPSRDDDCSFDSSNFGSSGTTDNYGSYGSLGTSKPCDGSCDCQKLCDDAEEADVAIPDMVWEGLEEDDNDNKHFDPWLILFPESPRNSHSLIPDEYYLAEHNLRWFCSQLRSDANIDESLPDFPGLLGQLRLVDYAAVQRNLVAKWHPGTLESFLSSSRFRHWLNTPKDTLFCTGTPGAGKTILMSAIVETMCQITCTLQKKIGIAYIYCTYEDGLDVIDIFVSVLEQLVRGLPGIPFYVECLLKSMKRNGSPLSIDDVSRSLLSLRPFYSRFYVLIDAFDEFSPDMRHQERLFDALLEMQKEHGCNIFATSRFSAPASRFIDSNGLLKIHPPIHDLVTYAESHLSFVESPVERDRIAHQIGDWLDRNGDGM